MSRLGHVVLVGLPGSGKSTVAPRLAARLGRRALDTDTEVERRLGATVTSIFREHGEARFRAEEAATLEAALASSEPLVISAGGGLIAQPGVAVDTSRRATVVWLDAGDEVLLARLAGEQARPLLAEGPATAMAELREARASAHGRSHVRVDAAGATPDDIVDRVACALQSTVVVNTDRQYTVTVASGALAGIAGHVPVSTRRVALVADQAVPAPSAEIAARLRDAGLSVTVIAVEGGETLKRWAAIGDLLERCSAAGLDRDDCVVAVGGGTVGDAAGFAAATYLRGIPWVVVPTTLLAMVDSAIGGKTAVNLARGKNLAGAFWQPASVVCDPSVLATLPERCHRSAFAEIVKSSMVVDGTLPAIVDARLQAGLARDPQACVELVFACCAFKAEVVSGDEREAGRRAILNYGHTVGHAVEALTGYGEGLDHGEAVAFGMRVAGALSVSSAGCPSADIDQQNAMLDACGLDQVPDLEPAAIAAELGADKKARAGVPRWVLLRRRGEPVTGVVLDAGVIRDAISEVCSR